MKIRQVGGKLFHVDRADGQTDMTKLIFALSKFANSPISVTFLAIRTKHTVSRFMTHHLQSAYTMR
jgi:hypothetical protein